MIRIRVMEQITVALILCLFSLAAFAEIPSETLEWRALMHYRPALFGGVKSTIDSPNFFLAKDGKTNPEAELQATIELFKQGEEKIQCIFPARYDFLKKQGLIHTPFPSCPEYESFKKDLKPTGVTLLYTDAYMNNPASLFGHTLMRIDIPEGKTQLVAHGVNYGASVPPDTNGMLFAILGLTGGYWGSFTVKPYYNVINMYNNLENRDIWEFHLNLTREEIDRFVAHLWEVGQTQTRYFFFSENCSYLLMEVLDAVRPEWRLSDDFPIHAIPLDTVKAIMKRKDIVDQVHYRPSRQKRIDIGYRDLDSKQKEALLRFLKDEEALPDSLSDGEKADILETAYEYTQYQWEAQKIPLKDYRRRSFRLLKDRTALNMTASERAIESPSPLTAHDSMRVVLSQGWRRGESFQEIAFRPAYHSLSDRPDGLRIGSEINFLNTKLRYYDKRQKFTLQQFDFVNIYSVSPWNALFRPISYQINFDIRREWNPKTQQEGYIGNLSGGSGISVELLPKTFGFVFAKAAGQYGGWMPHNIGVALGGETGVLSYLSWGQVRVGAEQLLSDNWFLNQTCAYAEAVYNITQNTALDVSYHFKKIKLHSTNDIVFGIRYFF